MQRFDTVLVGVTVLVVPTVAAIFLGVPPEYTSPLLAAEAVLLVGIIGLQMVLLLDNAANEED